MPASSSHGSDVSASWYRRSCADVILLPVSCVTCTDVNSKHCVQYWPSHHYYRCPHVALGLIPNWKARHSQQASKLSLKVYIAVAPSSVPLPDLQQKPVPLGGSCIAWLNLPVYRSEPKNSVQHPGLECKQKIFAKGLHCHAMPAQQ